MISCPRHQYHKLSPTVFGKALRHNSFFVVTPSTNSSVIMGSYDSEPQLNTSKTYGDWRDRLVEDGYVVIKSAISEYKAKHYLDSMFEWLEGFPYGFEKDDPSTWGPQNLPAHIKGGMYHGYAVGHEKFFWEARTEPNIIDAFAKVWDTAELLVSFDGANITLPHPDRQPNAAWPHVDQSPKRKGLQCVQGLLNLAPNGPQDGGLIVLKGSSSLNEAFFKAHPGAGERTWGPADWFGFEKEEVQWLLDRGCETVKVCADPGDLILWDSRTVHYNCLPESEAVRSVLYMCYTPASYAKPDDLALKAQLFRDRKGTTHWPHANIFTERKYVQERLGKPETYVREKPVHEPEETDLVLKLAGLLPY